MSKIRVVLEAAKGLHPMAVHAYPSEKGKFKVHAVGSKVKHVNKGDTVSSSDLDDLSDAGHKVKEIKKPLSEGTSGSGGYRTKDGTYVPFKSYEKAGQEVRAKRADAGRALADADKKTRANAKEEVEPISELSPPVLARYVSKSHKDAMGHKAASRDYAMLGREATWQGDHKDAADMKAKSEKYKKQADKRTKGIEAATKRLAREEVEQVDELKSSTYTSYADKREKDVRSKSIMPGSKEHKQWKMVGKARDKAAEKMHRGGHMTPSMAREEVEQVDEKLTPEAKSAVRTALGPKTPGNQMRKSSQAARTLISVLKTNKKNVAEADDAGSVKQKAIQKYVDQGYSYNDAVQKAEIYVKKKKLM